MLGPGSGHGRVSKYFDLSKVETGVFWNMAECPIPEGMDITTLVGNITKSLKAEGFNGRITVYAYDHISHEERSYNDANVIASRLHSGDADANLRLTISSFLCWALRRPAPANIMVIVKDITVHSGIIRAFDRVTRKRYNCMVAQQVESREPFDDSIDKAWLWDHLAFGKPALSPPLTSSSTSHSQGDKSMQTQFMELKLKEISSDEADG
ncbi:unnamed protein product [Microthlaspi erraticum]|uniref:NYN domain-containing protein n=1 Tax=Microthlaspi erraticum TaxID=1685480 RepID=A0A6D2IN45_9BRAS|nr:unnamed protein product [Microthlaspi erraticum]